MKFGIKNYCRSASLISVVWALFVISPSFCFAFEAQPKVKHSKTRSGSAPCSQDQGGESRICCLSFSYFALEAFFNVRTSDDELKNSGSSKTVVV